jgi:hypothetical protein
VFFASGGTAGPGFYIVGGAALLCYGVLLGSDYRGWGTRYFLLFWKPVAMSPKRARWMKRYRRARYGVAVVVGLAMLVSGLFSL